MVSPEMVSIAQMSTNAAKKTPVWQKHHDVKITLGHIRANVSEASHMTTAGHVLTSTNVNLKSTDVLKTQNVQIHSAHSVVNVSLDILEMVLFAEISTNVRHLVTDVI